MYHNIRHVVSTCFVCCFRQKQLLLVQLHWKQWKTYLPTFFRLFRLYRNIVELFEIWMWIFIYVLRIIYRRVIWLIYSCFTNILSVKNCYALQQSYLLLPFKHEPVWWFGCNSHWYLYTQLNIIYTQPK